MIKMTEAGKNALIAYMITEFDRQLDTQIGKLVHDHIGCIETGIRITSYTNIRFTIDLNMSGETALRILQYPEKYADYTRRPRIVSRNSKTKKRE